jgi:tRNA(Ile)-lysidine synthase
VFETIRQERMLAPGDRAGIAVSGGADSVALLRLLEILRDRLGIAVLVVHFNHKLRGAESDADAEFVAKMSRRRQPRTNGISRTPRGASATHSSSAWSLKAGPRASWSRTLQTIRPRRFSPTSFEARA